MTSITATLDVSFASVLMAKVHRWVRRNLWLYLLAGSLISVGLGGDMLGTAAKVIPGILALSWFAMVLSAAVQSRVLKHKALTLVFRPNEVLLRNHEGERTVDWAWLQPVTETRSHFVFRRNGNARDLLFVRKLGSSLPTAEHVEVLRSWAKT